MSIKDRLYDYVVRKNENVRYEYERYVMEHTIEHYENRIKHWKILWKLNWHYRVKKKNEPMMYWENENKKVNVAKVSNFENKVEKKVSRIPEGNVFCGAESSMTNLLTPYHLAQRLLKYDVISFDIFDTLIFRPFSDPRDLFIVAQYKLNYDKFYDIRISCELKARAMKESLMGNREINIFNIYDLIQYQTGIECAKGVEVEFELEKEFCFVNPYMKEVFEILRAHNKTIILASDMYYPCNMLEELLTKKGFTGYEKLFVSCDYEANKASGRLYQFILEEYKGKSICQVGDNLKADIEIPKTLGMDSIWYPNVQTRGNRYRVATRAMSKIIGSAYAGISNTHLWNGIKQYSLMYEFGFLYGGIYVLGYMNWVYRFCKRNNVDKIIFLSRDGYIYQRVFELLYDDVEHEYLFWSRAITATLSVNTEREEFVKFIKIAKQEYGSNWMRVIFKELGIDALIEELSEQEIIYLSSCDENWIDFLYRNWEKIKKILENDTSLIEEKVLSMAAKCESVAIVDVGWNATSGHQIHKILQKKGIKAYSLVVGALNKNGNENRLLEGKQFAYAFAINKNQILYNLFMRENSKNAAIFELFTQAQSPMLKKYKRTVDGIGYVFFKPEPELYEYIDEIHMGILDFCKIWKEKFGEYSFLNNISGYDALNPYRVLANDPYYFKENLKKFEVITKILI